MDIITILVQEDRTIKGSIFFHLIIKSKCGWRGMLPFPLLKFLFDLTISLCYKLVNYFEASIMDKKFPWLCSGILSIFLSSQIISANPGEQADEQTQQQRTSLVVLPVIFYMPETKWGAGVGGIYAFRPLLSNEKTRPSSLYFVIFYTQLKQFSIELEPELYLKKEAYLINGSLSWSKYPDKFFGIGNKTPDAWEQGYTPQIISFKLALQKRLYAKENIYLGIQYAFENYKMKKIESSPELIPAEQLLALQKINGSQGGTTSGLGFNLKWDTRDNIFFPGKGNYFQISTYFFIKALSSDFKYSSLEVDLRKYFSLFSGQVLAFQGLVQSRSGTAPFYSLSKLGGESVMRGYYSGRYRDKILLAFQAEYRLPIWKRFGLVGFIGAGDVAEKFGDFRVADFKYSVGWGIRFKIVPSEGTNLRLDFGYGKGTSGVYFTASEAF